MQFRTAFVTQRLATAALTLWIVVSAVFVMLRLSGDPVRLLLSIDARPEQVEALRRELGLDAPLPTQYARFLGELVRGNLGESLQQRRPALDVVLERLPATLELAAAAFLLAATVGPGLGLVAALRRGTPSDRLAMAFASLLQAGPPFFVGILLILLLTVRLGWLPSSGRGDPDQLVLPAITVGASLLATLARLTRSALLDTLGTDYVRTARAKGLGESVVVRRHALRTATLPLVTVAGLELGGLLSGAIVAEIVFAWPGVGRLAVDAVNSRDYQVVQASVLVIATIFVALNLLVDLSYAILDPRVRDV